MRNLKRTAVAAGPRIPFRAMWVFFVDTCNVQKRFQIFEKHCIYNDVSSYIPEGKGHWPQRSEILSICDKDTISQDIIVARRELSGTPAGNAQNFLKTRVCSNSRKKGEGEERARFSHPLHAAGSIRISIRGSPRRFVIRQCRAAITCTRAEVD